MTPVLDFDDAELRAAARRVARRGPAVPDDLDASIRALLAAAPTAQRRPSLRTTAARLAVAAAIVLLATAAVVAPRRSTVSVRAPFAEADLDRSGAVDVLDALLFAKSLAGDGAGRLPDENRDGVVDDDDVTALLARIVRLSPEDGA